MGKGEDELGVENLPHACYRLLKNRGLSLSVHFYMILPATLDTPSGCAWKRARRSMSGSPFSLQVRFTTVQGRATNSMDCG